MVDKYSWVDVGSSYLMNDVSAAYLWGQLEYTDEINQNRLKSWKIYYDGLKELEERGYLELPSIPKDCIHNGHIFYTKVKDLDTRTELLAYLKEREITAVFHYVPLHSSQAGERFGRICGEDRWTTLESQRVIRLPLYYGITRADLQHVIDTLYRYFTPDIKIQRVQRRQHV
jgi:dTDP-4-amino-4,6-dideoxygalactose transaminase